MSKASIAEGQLRAFLGSPTANPTVIRSKAIGLRRFNLSREMKSICNDWIYDCDLKRQRAIPEPDGIADAIGTFRDEVRRN